MILHEPYFSEHSQHLLKLVLRNSNIKSNMQWSWVHQGSNRKLSESQVKHMPDLSWLVPCLETLIEYKHLPFIQRTLSVTKMINPTFFNGCACNETISEGRFGIRELVKSLSPFSFAFDVREWVWIHARQDLIMSQWGTMIQNGTCKWVSRTYLPSEAMKKASTWVTKCHSCDHLSCEGP